MSDMNVNHLSLTSSEKDAMKPIKPRAEDVTSLTRTSSNTSLNIRKHLDLDSTTTSILDELCDNMKEVKGITSSSITSNSPIGKIAKKDKKKKKKQCHFGDCTGLSIKYAGDCNFCNGKFCSKHRMLENHLCKGLQSCKEQMHKRNADKLASEQTVNPKVTF
ncbi:hypothetical protein Kpol_303p6 [Vanderwaltozyma polyspora DSM 70294]|uniref:AN1-type domain-containing protein n=1 Tax=Vanderwaltozyma polyspora (strain ATCC 22028 / DSM 70294 / BCRC 21397 / CBS 2163 / NBRC 10782 / NRRL Y-8283 / UCD 57-17) TaxID=436907 RepID=A7TT03_VANPO|nr:uncharacterized protein Kpol_303p6 [Vanderwaltozyma polyspora DSM 70294]EDO14607.1 hypothetical protein Kpol_303p6 [Vanderwaltozyma polyspora DSM 70294]